jgi:hypothetical protein
MTTKHRIHLSHARILLLVNRFLDVPLPGAGQQLRWERLAQDSDAAYLHGTLSDTEYDSVRTTLYPYVG